MNKLKTQLKLQLQIFLETVMMENNSFSTSKKGKSVRIGLITGNAIAVVVILFVIVIILLKSKNGNGKGANDKTDEVFSERHQDISSRRNFKSPSFNSSGYIIYVPNNRVMEDPFL